METLEDNLNNQNALEQRENPLERQNNNEILEMYPNQNHLLNPEENGELRRRIKNMDCRAGCKNGTRNIIKALVITNTINFICEISRENPFGDLSRVVACLGLSAFIAFLYWCYGSNAFANYFREKRKANSIFFAGRFFILS